MWQIVLNGPGYLDTRYELPPGETSLGRGDENDIVLVGDLVSRRHARLRASPEGLAVEDAGSTNGTFVNGARIGGPRPLAAGDLLELGENRIAIRWGEVRSEAQSTVVVRTDAEAAPPVARLRRARSLGLREALVREPDLATLALLYRVSERLATAPTLERFLEDVAALTLDLARARTVVVLLREGDKLKPAAMRHRGGLRRGEVPVSDAIIEECMRTRLALCVDDALADERFAGRESVVRYGVQQVICAPILLAGEVEGVLYLTRDPDDAQPQPLVDAVIAVAHLTGTGLEQQRLRERALEQERVRQRLERFLAAEVVEQAVLDFGTGASPRMEEREVTLLFADISGFTPLTERLPPPRVVELLDSFYRRMTRVVFEHGGTVDKFMGDAVMALFGAPYGAPDDASRALRAALAMRAEFDRMMEDWPESERCKLKLGLNTGRVLAGTVGGEERLEYTAVGDPVNVAARLVQDASPGQILVGAATIASVGSGFRCRSLGERFVRGRSCAVEVWELEALSDPPVADPLVGRVA